MVYVHPSGVSDPLRVKVQFQVERKETRVLGAANGDVPQNNSKNGLDVYLQPDRLVPTGGRYLDIANKETANDEDTLGKMRALFEHIVATMQYDYDKESPKFGDGDVAWVCDFKKGNCSDLHSYFISLARSLEIPAVLEYGFPVAGVPVADELPSEGTIGG